MKKTTGIILHTLDYRDHDRILTLFTEEMGIVKLIAYRAKKGNNISPMILAEFVYKDGKGELGSMREITKLNEFLILRRQLEHLQASCEMLQAIRKTQMPGKAAPALYKLLLYYLEKIPSVEDPRILTSSFLLKILKHDGHYYPNGVCSVCESVSNRGFYGGGTSYCVQHRPYGSIGITEEEAELMQLLTFGQKFSDLACLKIPNGFYEKVQKIFADQLQDFS